MMAVYSRNLQALRERQPEIAAFVDSLNVSDYHVTTAVSGDAVLRVRKNSGEEVAIDHSDDPLAEASGFIPSLPDDRHFFLLMGIGLGYALFETVRRYPQSRMLVIEHDARIFKRALETFDFVPYIKNPNVEFIVAVKFPALPRLFLNGFARNDNDLYLPGLRLVQNQRVVAYSKDYYATAARVFTQCVKNYWEVYVGNDYRDALKGMRYVLANLKDVSRLLSLEPYTERYKGATGIVVSSGPSLDASLDFLRDVQDRALLICADSALKKLLANGIKPFGVACVERDDINAELFQGFDIPDDIVLFAPPVLKPVTFATYPGPIVTFFRRAYPFPGLPGLLPCRDFGISCSHLSYQVLNWLDCARIALVGQDLAYDRDSGKSHFSGVIDFAENQYAPQTRAFEPDNNGGTIPTSRDWMLFRDFFEELYAVNRSSHELVNVIDARRGLLIKGVSRVDPESFFKALRAGGDKPVPFDPREGKLGFARSAAGFSEKMATLKEDLLDAVARLQGAVPDLAAAPNVTAYLEARARLFSGFSSQASYLILELLKPHLKAFDANAVSLWDDAAFCQRAPDFMALLARIVEELAQVWRDA